MKPLIGISPYTFNLGTKKETIGIYRSYIRAVENAGATSIILTPDLSQVSRYLQIIDGLLLTGGDDIHPKFFRKPLPKAPVTLSPGERTEFDLSLLKEFLKADRPVLGICLGCQTLNVALGGTLIQDLSTEKPGTKNHQKKNHKITIFSSSKLKKIFGNQTLIVNSRHHQAVDKIGSGLAIAAQSHDQVTEAIESSNHTFVFGVQWHPEELPKKKETQLLFKSFVNACRRNLNRLK